MIMFMFLITEDMQNPYIDEHKATPNQLLVSHPPSALKLMRGRHFWRVMVVKITSSTRPTDEKQLIDLERPNAKLS